MRHAKKRPWGGLRADARQAASGTPELLDFTPTRLAEWREVGVRIVVERPRPTASGLKGVGQQFAYLMAARRIRLDDVGSFSWRCFDGKTSCRSVCDAMREEFGDAIEPVEERLGRFLRMLLQERLVRLDPPA